MAKSSTPFFSIVIPTLNEETALPLLLADLAAQTWSDFEVLHVDGNSQDKTVALSQQWQKKLPMVMMTTSTRNVGHQRNLGAQRAKGRWIIFMDADNRLPIYFLLGIKYQLDKQPDVDIFTCWHEIKAYHGADRTLMYLSDLALESMTKLNPCAPGALIGLRRSIIQEVLFDEKITVSEDHDFVRRVVKAGHIFKVLREPRYVYSLRRYKKEGTLKTLRTYAKLQYKIIMGQKVTKQLPEYPMIGGQFYQVPVGTPPNQTQLQRLRQRLTEIISFIEET